MHYFLLKGSKEVEFLQENVLTSGGFPCIFRIRTAFVDQMNNTYMTYIKMFTVS